MKVERLTSKKIQYLIYSKEEFELREFDPKNLYYYGMQITDELKYWTAFYTKPRNEKKVSERLLGSGFEIYCPVRTVLKQWSDRKKKIKEVLFTSYLFAYVNENERRTNFK